MKALTVLNDLRGALGPARNQGTRPTCLAFALSDTHAVRRSGNWEPLSCEYLFYHAKQRDKTPEHQGATVAAARAALEKDGQPLETDWPYQKTAPADRTKWKPPGSIGTVYRSSSVPGTPGFQATWDAVESGKAVVLVMTLSAAFYMPSPEGVVDSTEAPDPSRVHAVVAVATAKRGNSRLLMVRNSWGDEWGSNGYAWLSEQYLTPRTVSTLTLA